MLLLLYRYGYKNLFKIIFNYVSLSGYVQMSPRDWEHRDQNPLELQLQRGCERPGMGFGTKHGSSERTVSSLSHGAISPAPCLDIFIDLFLEAL